MSFINISRQSIHLLNRTCSNATRTPRIKNKFNRRNSLFGLQKRSIATVPSVFGGCQPEFPKKL